MIINDFNLPLESGFVTTGRNQMMALNMTQRKLEMPLFSASWMFLRALARPLRAPLWRHGKMPERDDLTFCCSLIHYLSIPLFTHSSKHSSVSVPSSPPSFPPTQPSLRHQILDSVYVAGTGLCAETQRKPKQHSLVGEREANQRIAQSVLTECCQSHRYPQGL